MTDEQKLYELLKDFDPAVGERMEQHFKLGRDREETQAADGERFAGKRIRDIAEKSKPKRYNKGNRLLGCLNRKEK